MPVAGKTDYNSYTHNMIFKSYLLHSNCIYFHLLIIPLVFSICVYIRVHHILERVAKGSLQVVHPKYFPELSLQRLSRVRRGNHCQACEELPVGT